MVDSTPLNVGVPRQVQEIHKTYILTEEHGGTRLTVTLSGYEQEPNDTRWNNLERDTFGFGMMLQNTKAYIEGQSLPYPGGF